jgi:hypothetical protein
MDEYSIALLLLVDTGRGRMIEEALDLQNSKNKREG